MSPSRRHFGEALPNLALVGSEGVGNSGNLEAPSLDTLDFDSECCA